MTIARVALWMSRRYGVDLSKTSSAEVLARAATILGVRQDGDAARLAIVNLRIDADEREYERDEHGRFGSGGGGGDGPAPKSERLRDLRGAQQAAASGDHERARELFSRHKVDYLPTHASTSASDAQVHADRAKTAASGTSPSARASARKSADSASQAKIAAAAGNHREAAIHAAEAKRHADVATEKAAAHRDETPPAATRAEKVAAVVASVNSARASAEAAHQTYKGKAEVATSASSHAQVNPSIQSHVDAASAHRDAAAAAYATGSLGRAGDAHARVAADHDEKADRARQRVVPGFAVPDDKTLVHGVPHRDAVSSKSVYVIHPKDLAERAIAMPGGGTDKNRMASVGKVMSEGKAPPVKLTMLPNGKLYTEDGRHRILTALANNQPIVAHISKGATNASAAGTVPLASRP